MTDAQLKQYIADTVNALLQNQGFLHYGMGVSSTGFNHQPSTYEVFPFRTLLISITHLIME